MSFQVTLLFWIPAFAGMTDNKLSCNRSRGKYAAGWQPRGTGFQPVKTRPRWPCHVGFGDGKCQSWEKHPQAALEAATPVNGYAFFLLGALSIVYRVFCARAAIFNGKKSAVNGQ